MQPPPFEAPRAPQKKGSPWPWIIVGGVLVCCIGPVALMGGGIFFAAKQGLPMAECGIMFSSIGRALGKYAAAHDGKLPNAKTWQTDIAKYYDEAVPPKGESGPINVPTSKDAFGCGDSPKTAVVFNEAYSGKVLAQIKDPEAILVFETNQTPGMNKYGPYKDPGKAASPRIFNEARGWFAVNATLNDVMIEDGRQTSGFGGRSRRR